MGIVIKFDKVLQLNQMSLKFNVKSSFDLEIMIATHVWFVVHEHHSKHRFNSTVQLSGHG